MRQMTRPTVARLSETGRDHRECRRDASLPDNLAENTGGARVVPGFELVAAAKLTEYWWTGIRQDWRSRTERAVQPAAGPNEFEWRHA